MIKYVEGDATKPLGDGRKVIVHCVNDIGIWGRGFVLALSKRWPSVEESYRDWHSDGGCVLGGMLLVEAETNIYVANVVGQKGIARAGNRIPIRYEALEFGLFKLAHDIDEDTTLHMPRIGCGLAGGSWDKVEPIIGRTLGRFNITVYDLPTQRQM